MSEETFDEFPVTLIDQIMFVEREIRMRTRNADPQDDSGEAMNEISVMRATLRTLNRVYAKSKGDRASLPENWRCEYCRLSKSELEYLE